MTKATKKKSSSRIETVNVVETYDGRVRNVISFKDTIAGNEEAQNVFSTILNEHGINVDGIDGFYYSDDDGYEVEIV